MRWQGAAAVGAIRQHHRRPPALMALPGVCPADFELLLKLPPPPPRLGTATPSNDFRSDDLPPSRLDGAFLPPPPPLAPLPALLLDVAYATPSNDTDDPESTPLPSPLPLLLPPLSPSLPASFSTCSLLCCSLTLKLWPRLCLSPDTLVPFGFHRSFGSITSSFWNVLMYDTGPVSTDVPT